MSPQISLITPVFNGEAHLRRCVESIVTAAEGYCVELILVDDGSTDGTPEVALALAEEHDWIRYLRQPNGGPSSARNAGLELARGKYVGFVDSDDCVMPSYVSTLVETCADSPEIIVFGYERRLLRDAVTVHAPKPSVHVDESDRLLSNVSGDRELFWFPWTKLFRADVIREIRFNESLRLGEDTIFNLQTVAKASVIVRIPQVLYSHTETAGSLSSPTYKKRLMENMDEHFSARLRVHEQLGQDIVGPVRMDVCKYYLGHIVPWLLSNAMRMRKQEQIAELSRVRASTLVTTCFEWNENIGGSRGLSLMLYLLRFRMLRLLRWLLSARLNSGTGSSGGAA